LNGPWNSGLKMHAAGDLYYTDGSLEYRGSGGTYWGSTPFGSTSGWMLAFTGGTCGMGANDKAFGFPLRCIKDN